MDNSYAKKLRGFEEDRTFIEIYDKDQGVPMGLFGRGIISKLNEHGNGNWDIELTDEKGTYHFKFDENNIIIYRVNT